MSTWFANARRRLKKENKMTWEPKNKLDDEDVDVSDDEDKDNSFCRDEKSGKQTPSVTIKTFSNTFSVATIVNLAPAPAPADWLSSVVLSWMF